MKFDDYATEISECMAAAWDHTREHNIIKKAQKEKIQHDTHIVNRDCGFHVGNSVFVWTFKGAAQCFTYIILPTQYLGICT